MALNSDEFNLRFDYIRAAEKYARPPIGAVEGARTLTHQMVTDLVTQADSESKALLRRDKQLAQAMSLLRSVFSLLGWELVGKPEQVEIMLQMILDKCHCQVFSHGDRQSQYVVKVSERGQE